MKRILGIAAALSLLGAGTTATAGELDPDNSFLTVVLSALAPIEISATGNPGTATLMDDGLGGHKIVDDATVWSTVNFGPGTSLFTGVPLITNLKLTVRNGPGMLTDGFASNIPTTNGGFPAIQFMCDPPCMGGIEQMDGQAVISVLGGILMVPVDLSVVGGPLGGTTMVTVASSPLTVHGAPFVTGWAQITGITTNVVTVPSLGNQQGVPFTLGLAPSATVMTLTTGGGYASTATGPIAEQNFVDIHGTNGLLSASKPGMVTLISPMRIDTGNLVGNIPGVVKKKFTFVPEPGTLALLIAGAGGLAAMGRRRMRK